MATNTYPLTLREFRFTLKTEPISYEKTGTLLLFRKKIPADWSKSLNLGIDIKRLNFDKWYRSIDHTCLEGQLVDFTPRQSTATNSFAYPTLLNEIVVMPQPPLAPNMPVLWTSLVQTQNTLKGERFQH